MHKIHRKRVAISGHDAQQMARIKACRIKYGLRNVSQYAAALFRVRQCRRARFLDDRNKSEFKARLARQGVIPDRETSLLSVTVQHFLDRRLQSVIARKYGVTMKAARNWITGPGVQCGDRRLKWPSYPVRRASEGFLKVRGKTPIFSKSDGQTAGDSRESTHG